MSTRSNVLRLAVFGLLLARAPRWVQRPLGSMLLGVILCFVLIALGVVARADEVCTVADPSGTPLNVRSQPKPNGSILGALNNDTSVVVKERRGQWARIVPENSGKAGWVWEDYLSCGRKWELDCRHVWIETKTGDEDTDIYITKRENESKLLRIEEAAVDGLQKALRDLKVCSERYWSCWAWANRNVGGVGTIKFKRKPSYC
jgi:hypothetical protein